MKLSTPQFTCVRDCRTAAIVPACRWSGAARALVLMFSILVSLSSASRVWAQAPTPLTLSDAIAKAMDTSHRLAEARARQEGAEAAVQVQRVADRPTLAVGGGYTRTNHVDQFFVPQPIGPPQVIYP